MRLAIVIIFLIVISFAILSFLFESEMKNYFFHASGRSFVFFMEAGDALASFMDFTSNKALKESNNQLQLEKKRLENELASLSLIREENEDMRQALDVGMQEDFDLLLAKVVFRNLSEKFILINKGEEDGLRLKMAVIDSHRRLVGRIDNLYVSFSMVRLLTNKQSVIGGRTEGGVLGQIKGDGIESSFLEFLASDERPADNALVFTSGTEENMPGGLIIGRVGQIETPDIRPYHRAEVNLDLRIEETRNVFIIQGY